MATIHISLDEVERNLHALLARLDENTSFVIENGNEPIAVLQPPPARKLSFEEKLALLPKDNEAVIDEDWPADLEEAIQRHRAPLDRKLWE